MNTKLKNTARKICPFIFIAAAAVVGVFLGRTLSSYELKYMLNRVYCGNYHGIDVYKSGAVNTDNLNAHINMLSYAPDALTQCCKTLYFTGEDLAVPVSEPGYDSALGLTQQDKVYISTLTYHPDVIIHELFHTYDHRGGVLSANSEEFLHAYENERDNITVTAGLKENHAAEYFAVAGTLYLLSPGELLSLAPETFIYFNGIFNMYLI